MKGEDDILEEENDGEDNLLDLSLDDLSPEDIDNGFSGNRTDEEIIELIDLVEKGNKGGEGVNAENTIPYEDDLPTKELGEATREAVEAPHEAVSFSETDLELAKISMESDLSMFETDGEDTGGSGEGFSEDDIAQMLRDETESDMDGASESGELPDDMIEESIVQEDAGEMDMTIKAPLAPQRAAEDLKEGSREEPGPRMSDASPAEAAEDEVMHLISEKKIEGIVKSVVEEVVERVARETMAEVAERVIKEAIEALKLGLEKGPE